MMSRARSSGFLLLEALVALALLATGLAVCLESFACVRTAMKRDQRRRTLAPCAETKLIEFSLGTTLPMPGCPSDIAWTAVTHPLPGRLERMVLTAAWREDERTEEETFESIRTAN